MQEVRELWSDTEEDEILEKREAVPLRIRNPGARGAPSNLKIRRSASSISGH